jgi:hypothetical protein
VAFSYGVKTVRNGAGLASNLKPESWLRVVSRSCFHQTVRLRELQRGLIRNAIRLPEPAFYSSLGRHAAYWRTWDKSPQAARRYFAATQQRLRPMLTISILFNRIVVSNRIVNGAYNCFTGGRRKPLSPVFQASAAALVKFFGFRGPMYVPFRLTPAAVRPSGFRY